MGAMEFIARERQQEYIRQADQERLARRALEGREPRLRPVLRTVGGALMRLGQSLQGAAERPQAAPQLRMVEHHM
jgi:hypothetical protein